MISDKKLFADFPPVTTQEWEEVIQAGLKGADYEKKLVWKTQEGFSVRPYYRSDDLKNISYLNTAPGSFPYVRGRKAGPSNWEIRQNIEVINEKEANAQAREALEKGATSIGFVNNDNHSSASIDVAALIQDICPKQHPIHFRVGVHSPYVLDSFIAEAKRRGIASPRGSVFYDPLGQLASCGCYYSKAEFPLDVLKKLMDASAALPGYRVIGVNGARFQNSGANLVQELAISLSMGVGYLTELTEDGYDAGAVASRMSFTFSAGSNYFMEIAKVRAARLLWAQIVRAYASASDDACAMYVHAETALWNKTIYDPHVNLLRTTTEAMSAVLGGVDSLTVLPFDVPYSTPDDFSIRLARNQQVVIKEEAHIGKTADPAGGSYYIETLTRSMADAAWKLFLDIMDRGGYVQAMKDGYIQGLVAESVAKKRKAVATRKEILLGTNQYAQEEERALDRVAAKPSKKTPCACASAQIAKKIPVFRLAADFEALRLRTERSGRTPVVFMLTIGNLIMRKARASFACNFFTVAGFQVCDNNGFDTLQAGISAAVEAKANIVVLCSSDDEYAALAPQAVALLKGKVMFVLAGYPKAIVDELKAAGVEHFIYAGQNVLEALTAYQNILGL